MLPSYAILDYHYEKVVLSILISHMCSFNGCSVIWLKEINRARNEANMLLSNVDVFNG